MPGQKGRKHVRAFGLKAWVFLFAGGALVLALVGCGAVGETPEDTLVIGQVAEPRSLDPHVATTTNDFRILSQVYEGLVRFRQGTLEIEGALAESWETDASGTTFTFHLRRGVRFHDGSPFNAEAVRYNFERMLNPEHPAVETGPFPMSFRYSMIRDIETPDEATVIFQLEEPYAPFLANLADPSGYIVSPDQVQNPEHPLGRNPSGTGPWTFVEWSRQRWVILERYEGYYDDPAQLKRLIFRPLPDVNARLTELLVGGVDLLVEAPADLIEHLRSRDAYTVVETVGPHLWFLILNTREPPFSDVRMRQAVNLAVNKEAIVKDLLQGTASVAHGVIPAAFAWAADPALEPYPYDPGRARELIAEAGYEGATVRLFATNSGSGMLDPLPMAEAIQADFAAVGLNLRIEVFEWNTFLSRVNSGLEGQAELAQMAWITSDPDTLPALSLSSQALPEHGGFNSGYYENEELDALLEEARRATDHAERGRIYRRIDRLVHEEVPFLFVASWRQNAVHRSDIRGLELEPSFLLNLRNVSKER